MPSRIVEHRSLDEMSRASAETAGKLRTYYLLRSAVAAAWVAAAFSIGTTASPAATVLLVAYPAWDAAANLIDASWNGGLARNRTQAFNAIVSAATAAAVLSVIGEMKAVIAVLGAWAILAGLLQLATGVRRWRTYGAQWAMILSGAQSALAGGFFIAKSRGDAAVGIVDVAPYAAFGAFYFLVSALWLTFRGRAARSTSAG